MTVNELREMAEAEKAKGHKYMVMVLVRATEPRGQWVRLLGREGPRGRFVGAERLTPKVVRVIADFGIGDILSWCDKHRPTS